MQVALQAKMEQQGPRFTLLHENNQKTDKINETTDFKTLTNK